MKNRRLNNKGFAITATLYTLFVLFLMILVSILAGLSTRKRLLEKSIEAISDEYHGTNYEGNYHEMTTAPVTGKYVFSDGSHECYTYLKKGTELKIDDLVYTTDECKIYIQTSPDSFVLYDIYSFEK